MQDNQAELENLEDNSLLSSDSLNDDDLSTADENETNGDEGGESEQSSIEAAQAALDDFNGDTEESSGEKDDAKDVADKDGDKPTEKPVEDDADNNDDGEASEEDLTTEPGGLSERASDRFKKLVESRNEAQEELNQSTQQIEAIKQAMQSSNATADDMGSFLEVTRLSRSASLDDRKAALAMLDKQRNELALSVGDATATTSALDAFPDLKQKVDTMEMEESTAMEIAQGRQQQRVMQAQQQQAQQQQEQQQYQQQTINDAVSKVEEMERDWIANDVDFKAKEALLIPQMQRINQTLPPEQWANATQIAYDAVTASMAAQENKPKPSPISRQGFSSGKNAEPKNALEAANLALSEME